MRVEGSSSVQMSRSDLWDALTDPAALSRALSATVAPAAGEGDRWEVIIRPSLGSLGRPRLRATFELVDQQPGEWLRIRMHAIGSENVVDAEGEARLSGDGQSTEVSWEGDVSLGGVIGSVGQRSGRDLVQAQIDQVLRSLSRAGA